MPPISSTELSFTSQQRAWRSSDDASVVGDAREAVEGEPLFASSVAAASAAPAAVPHSGELTRALAVAERASNARESLSKLLVNGADAGGSADAKALCEVSDVGLRNSLTALSARMNGRQGGEALGEARAWLDEAVDVLPEFALDAMALSAPMRSPVPTAAIAAGAGANTPGSYADFWDKLSDAIGGLKEGYLGVFETAVQKNNAFYRDFTDFVTKSTEWTKGDKDITLTLEGKDVVTPLTTEEIEKNFASIDQLFKDLGVFGALTGRKWIAKYANSDRATWRAEIAKDPHFQNPPVRSGFLFALKDLVEKYEPKPGASESIAHGVLVTADTEEKAKKWAKDMGLPDSAVQNNPDDPAQWWVKIDLEPVKNMIAALEALKTKPSDTEVTLTPARHTSYQSGADAQKEQLKTTASTLGQKMAGAQSIYENLIKVLTSTIAAMLETAKAFVQ